MIGTTWNGQGKNKNGKMYLKLDLTDNYKLRAVRYLAGSVPCYTSIVSRVSRLYGLDRQHADLLPTFRNEYSVVRGDWIPVEQPNYRDWGIPLGNATTDHCRTRAIIRLIAELERNHDRDHYEWGFWRRM